MDNIGIVVDDLGGTVEFFRELGLDLEGRATIEGEWAGRVTGWAISVDGLQRKIRIVSDLQRTMPGYPPVSAVFARQMMMLCAANFMGMFGFWRISRDVRNGR